MSRNRKRSEGDLKGKEEEKEGKEAVVKKEEVRKGVRRGAGGGRSIG